MSTSFLSGFIEERDPRSSARPSEFSGEQEIDEEIIYLHVDRGTFDHERELEPGQPDGMFHIKTVEELNVLRAGSTANEEELPAVEECHCEGECKCAHYKHDQTIIRGLTEYDVKALPKSPKIWIRKVGCNHLGGIFNVIMPEKTAVALGLIAA